MFCEAYEGESNSINIINKSGEIVGSIECTYLELSKQYTKPFIDLNDIKGKRT